MTAREIWRPVAGWPYEVSTLGHIRRKRSKKLINPWWDREGFGTVILTSGKRKAEYYLDTLICATFNDDPMEAIDGKRPLHLDGLPWNNWPINLRWSMQDDLENGDNLVINWTVRRNGKLQHGPFTDFGAARAAAQWIGDSIIGRNAKREIVMYEIMFSENREMSPRNPFDMVRYYRAQADLHKNQFWSIMLSEAAEIIEALARENLHYVSDGKQYPHAAPPQSNGGGQPTKRRRMALPGS
jgi:hypothetical protein